MLAIWREANTPDRPVKYSIVSTHHTFEDKQEQKAAVTYPECPLNVDTHVPVDVCQLFTLLS